MADAIDFFYISRYGELEKDLPLLQGVVERIFVLFDLVSCKFSGKVEGVGGFLPRCHATCKISGPR